MSAPVDEPCGSVLNRRNCAIRCATEPVLISACAGSIDEYRDVAGESACGEPNETAIVAASPSISTSNALVAGDALPAAYCSMRLSRNPVGWLLTSPTSFVRVTPAA